MKKRKSTLQIILEDDSRASIRMKASKDYNGNIDKVTKEDLEVITKKIKGIAHDLNDEGEYDFSNEARFSKVINNLVKKVYSELYVEEAEQRESWVRY